MSNTLENFSNNLLRGNSKQSDARSQLQKSPSQSLSGQSLLSARLTDSNGLLSINDNGFAQPADNNNPVTRIAQDLLKFQATRRPSTQSLRSEFLSNQNNSRTNLSTNYISNVEASILRSENPIQINESEEIEVNGERGLWANKSEVINWRGEIPIQEYLINQDTNPEIINKRSFQQLEYIQELAIRYLRPPTPPAPGEIIINQLPNFLTAPAPPLIVRQQPARPETPEPLLIREAPPQPPAQVGRKIITISGKRIPPPPRKVIVERLAPLPPKPQAVIVERWLPYAEVKRRVIFQKPSEADPIVVKPRNVIIQWEAPQVNVKKEFKYLGVIRANPNEYVQRYGDLLKPANELPDFVLDIKTPDGLVLAADKKYNPVHELEGDVQALNLIDLDQEGLSEYKNYLQRSSRPSSNLSRSVSAAFVGSNSFGSRKPSFSNASQFGVTQPILSRKPSLSSVPAAVDNSALFNSASFVSQRPPSHISVKTPSIQKAPSVASLHSRPQSNYAEPAPSVYSIPKAPSVASLNSRTQSIKSEKAPSVYSIPKAPSVASIYSRPQSNNAQPEKAPSVRSISKAPSEASIHSRTQSINNEPTFSAPFSIPISIETSRTTPRSILKSASTVLPEPTYSNQSIPARSGASVFSYSSTTLNRNPKSFSSTDSISNLIEKIFRSIDKNNKGTITVEDAEKILLRLNSRLGRRYGEDDVKALFATLDINNDNQLDLEEFKRAFLNLAN